MEHLWPFVVFGYLASVFIETPVLVLGLSAQHSCGKRLLAGLWLTACTYPVVILVLPSVADPVEQRAVYLLMAETFAPLAECLLFVAAFAGRWRDCGAIVLANLLSFGIGEALFRIGGFA